MGFFCAAAAGSNPLWHIVRVGVLTLTALAAAAESGTIEVDSAADGRLDLETAVARALERNPGLAELRTRAGALATVPDQAGALPDPMLSLNLANLPVDTFELDQEPMTQVQLAVNQTLPFPGKRRLRRSAAEHDAAAAAGQTAERRLTLVAQVRSAWWQVFQLDRAIDIVSRNQELMRDFVEIARARYAVGGGLQQDVLLAQLELSRLMERRIGLEGQRRAAAAGLNALLDRPADAPARLPDEVPGTVLPELPAEADLFTAAAAGRPLLESLRSRLDAAAVRADLARRDAYPDLKLGAGYGYRQGRDPMRDEPRPDFFSVMLSVDVPIHFRHKQGRAIEQRQGEEAAARLMLDDTLRSVQADVATHKAAYEAARQQESLLRTGIIPQAEQTVSSMLAGYRVDQVDFLNVVTSQITLYNARISHWTALAQAKQALAQLAAAAGQEALYE